MIDGQLAINDFLEVGRNVAEAEVKALEGLELVGYPSREGADGYIAYVAQEVLDANLLGLLGLDYRRCVNEGLGCGGAVLNSLSVLTCA
jgi:hypothetical protein